MKKLTIPLVAAVAIGILLLSSFLAMSTFSVEADPAAGTQWQLSIAGLVENPLNLTLTDLAAMPQITVDANIYCVDFPTTVVTGGSWTGVKLGFLLNEAVVLPSGVKVAFYAADGYSTDLDLATATRENVILAYERDGAPLSETLRLVVPGKWGYKWITQVTNIVIVNYDFLGKWESQGYSDTADLQLIPSPPIPQPQQTFPNSAPSQLIEPTTPPTNTQPSNSSSSAPSQETQNPKPEATAQNPEPIPATWIVAAVAVVFVSISMLVYVKKRRH